MRWPKPQPRSLRRLAVRRQAEAEGIGLAGRAWRRARRWGWRLFHHRLWSLVLPVVAVVIGFVVPADVTLRPFRGLDEAPSALEVLWQVQAAALALSLAVVIFIFEAVYSARPRPSIRDLAEGVGLPAIFYAGLGGLALTGMVVLGGGSGAPGGWAATWAVVWAALSGLSLIVLFVAMLRDIEPDALYARWLARLREQVEQAIEHEIFMRLAMNLLNDVCQRAAIEFKPVFGSWAPTQLQPISAPRRGMIGDINLWRVTKAGRLSRELDVARAHADEQPTVLVYVGDGIGKGQPMMRVARVVAGLVGLERAFKIVDREPEAALDVALTQLHDEAVRLIRDGSPGAYTRITEVYEHLLLAQPETWARYGQRFGPGVAGGVHPFELTLLDRVERRLYEELELAVQSPSREIGREALNLPIAVAFRTIEPRAIALAGRMLRLFVAVQNTLIRESASDKRNALFGNSWLRLSEYGRAVEHLVTEDESTAEERAYGAQALRQVFDAYALMAKAFIDHNPREAGSLTEINRYLDSFLRHWNPEHDRPFDWEVEHLAARDDVGARELQRLRVQLAEKQAREEIKEELDSWRAAQRFALLSWSLRRLRASGDTVYVEPWNAFIGYFGDVEKTARVVDRALEADFRDRAQWSDWLLSELPMGEAHFVGVDREFVQTLVVVALTRVNPDGAIPQIPPLEWLANRAADIRQVIDGVRAQENLRAVLPEDRLEERAEIVAEAIEAMARARDEQEEQRIIDSPLDLGAVDEFRARVRTAWASRRLIAPALLRVGMYETPEEEAPDGTRLGIQPALTLKGLFVPDARIVGADMRATDIGHRLAASEIRRFAESAHGSPQVVAAPGESLAQALRRAIAEVREHGEELIVLAPSRWQLIQALELTLAERRGGDAQPPRWVPEEQARESFLGTAEGVPVFDSHELPPDKIVVIAIDRFARWRQWKLQDDHEVHVSITDYHEEAARALAEEREDLFRTEELTTVEARAREIRKAVLLDVFEKFAIEVVEPAAARCVPVPEDRRDY